MRPFRQHSAASRALVYAAIATAVTTGLATWLGYILVARSDPAGAQPLLWLGLATLLLEVCIAGWGIRAIETRAEHQKREHLDFFAAAVHDLRQPLQAATLFVDNLLHASLSPQLFKTTQRLDQSIQSVRDILDDLLDTSNLDGGAVAAKQKPFSLIALLQSLDEEFAPQAVSKNLRFRFYCPIADVCVYSDPQLVQTILRKLLINAIAETHQGGILLGVRQKGSQVHIQVWDTRINTPRVGSKSSARCRLVANRLAALIQSPLAFQSTIERGAVSTLTLSRHSIPPMQP